MAALMAPGTVAALLAPEPPAPETPATGGFVETVWAPIRDLLGRLGPLAVPVLALVAGFRMPGYVSNAMAIPLFKTLGYSNTDIATVTKLFGFWIALGGTFLASAIIPRIGMMASLLIGTVTASASHLALAYLAWHGGHGGAAFWTFALTVGIDGFAYAFDRLRVVLRRHVPDRGAGGPALPLRGAPARADGSLRAGGLRLTRAACPARCPKRDRTQKVSL
jgi:PAT family beta-lactamase induction signal transducer AmpG